jgi:hypothetical protein
VNSEEGRVRVERGQAGGEELAALVAVLLALRGEPPVKGPARAGSRWWRRREGYTAPGSWR